MKLAGFDGCEVGHKYPEDKTVLKHMLDVRNMTIASKWFSSFLVDKPYEEVEAEFIKELDYLSYVGATAINVSEQSGSCLLYTSLRHQGCTDLHRPEHR